jgi:hypothetical protein
MEGLKRAKCNTDLRFSSVMDVANGDDIVNLVIFKETIF